MLEVRVVIVAVSEHLGARFPSDFFNQSTEFITTPTITIHFIACFAAYASMDDILDIG